MNGVADGLADRAADFAQQSPAAVCETLGERLKQARLNQDLTQTDVAEQAGVVVGAVLLYARGAAFAYLESNDNLPEVRLLAVLPSARGEGIGAALMDECVRRGRMLGCKVLVLHTMEMMRAAKHLYMRMGFVRAPELDFVPRKDILAEGYRLELDT